MNLANPAVRGVTISFLHQDSAAWEELASLRNLCKRPAKSC